MIIQVAGGFLLETNLRVFEIAIYKVVAYDDRSTWKSLL